VQALDTLRRKGFAGKLTLWAMSRGCPTNGRAVEEVPGRRARARAPDNPPGAFFAEHQVQAQLGRASARSGGASSACGSTDDTVLAYDALLLATGSRPRRLAAPGTELAGVHFLAHLADADRIRAECGLGGRMVIIGGGYIGLEVAATRAGSGSR